MTTTNPAGGNRMVVANISLSLDGRVHGTAGEHDMGWIVPHAVSDEARDHMVRVTSPATTALLGRMNYEGFGQYWPPVAADEDADPRDRAFSRWLNEVDKVVFSSTLTGSGTGTEPTWADTTLTSRSPADVVAELRTRPGGDIVVLASGSVIRSLLDADAVDRLSITLCPETVGGGPRLFDDGVTAGGSWRLADQTVTGSGAICLLYDRTR